MANSDDDASALLTRRRMLAGTVAAGVAVAAGCAPGAGETDTDAETGTDGGDVVPVPDGMSAVSFVQRDGALASVRRAIDLAGGIDEIEPGMQFQAESEQGMRIITVTGVDHDVITVDGNHPLAGETLTFDVEVARVRDATEEEIAHGHAHED